MLVLAASSRFKTTLAAGLSLTKWKGKTLDGVVERVFSGDRLLVRLSRRTSKHHQVITLVAGIPRASYGENKCPLTAVSNPPRSMGTRPEPSSNSACFSAWSRSRLLGRALRDSSSRPSFTRAATSQNSFAGWPRTVQ